jgi:hypothetical protein
LAAAIIGLLTSLPMRAGEPILAGYTDYETLVGQLKSLSDGPLCSLESLGTTLGNREVFLLKIGTAKKDEKPAILVVGNVHAPQLLGSELALRLAQRLVEKGAADAIVGKLLERFTFYVIPRPTPDASEAFFRKPYREQQGNARPVDHDHDGQCGEDGPEDLNGDGLITLLRVEDPGGAWRADVDDPRLLVRADPAKNEQGRYALYPEGRDRDGDGQIAEDPPEGVVFNQNFPFKYPYYEPQAGPHAVSEVETRAVADFAFSHPNIAAVFTFTPEDNLVRPWKPDAAGESQRIKTAVLAADAPYYEHIGALYRTIAETKDVSDAPPAKGSFSEWVYFQYGRWSFASRGWSIPKVESAAKATRDSEELNALRWFAREKIDGFVAWKPIVHPDFPGKKAEVGGFKPFVRLNPPAALLEPLAERHFNFLCRVAGLLPRLMLQETKVDALGSGAYRITAQVLNSGYLPTMSKMGQVTHEAYPLQIKLDLPKDVSLITASPRTELPVLAGNGGKAEHSWLVLAAQPGVKRLQIRVYSLMVGEANAIVEIGGEKPQAFQQVKEKQL